MSKIMYITKFSQITSA